MLVVRTAGVDMVKQVCLSLFLSFSLSSLSLFLSFSLSLLSSLFLSFSLSLFSLSLFLSFSLCLFVSLSLCLFVSLSLCLLSLCLFVSLSLSLSFSSFSLFLSFSLTLSQASSLQLQSMCLVNTWTPTRQRVHTRPGQDVKRLPWRHTEMCEKGEVTSGQEGHTVERVTGVDVAGYGKKSHPMVAERHCPGDAFSYCQAREGDRRA